MTKRAKPGGDPRKSWVVAARETVTRNVKAVKDFVTDTVQSGKLDMLVGSAAFGSGFQRGRLLLLAIGSAIFLMGMRRFEDHVRTPKRPNGGSHHHLTKGPETAPS